MKQTIFFALLGFISTAAFAAPNESRSGMPTDTGTSVDKLMEDKIPAPQDEATPPIAGEAPVKKLPVKPMKKVVEEPAEGTN